MARGPDCATGALMDANRWVAPASGSSIFFPSFRRIEGGFSIRPRPGEQAGTSSKLGAVPGETPDAGSGLDWLRAELNRLAEQISVGAHRLVASISTDDITQLLTSHYTQMSDKNNSLYVELSNFVLAHFHEGPNVVAGTKSSQLSPATESLEAIGRKARDLKKQSEEIWRPFNVLSDLIGEMFQRGIKLGPVVTLGLGLDTVASDVLSAGEKQMLSFLCYNAFASDTSLFIDEPEISLHVDWQRVLFPVLLKQSTGNQFIVATHSPFIYTKYADKELVLAADRGDQHANSPNDGDGDTRLPEEDEPADLARRG